MFADIGQCSKEDLDLFDFSVFPNLDAWIGRMKKLPGYAESHAGIADLKPMMDMAKQQQAKL